MARVKFDLGDCLGYTYNGQTYSAKELFDKLRTGELKTLIAQGKVALSKDQAPTVVEEYVKKEVVKATRRPKVGSSDEEVMSEYLLNQPVYYRLRNGDKITQSIALVEDYIKENGKIAFIKLQNVDTPIPLNDVSKTKACHDANIDLCIIDTSQQKYFKPLTSQKYLDIIIDIIKERN
jgi:GTPase SAR1 family protein